MAIRISIDKTFSDSEKMIKTLVKEESSDPNGIIFTKLFEDKNFKIIKVSGLQSDEEQGIIQNVIESGYPARGIPE